MVTTASSALGGGKPFHMFILGFASGLPYAIFTGTVVAWIAWHGVDTKTIGVLSWAGLAYAFKFLWSPSIGAIKPINLLPGVSIGKLRRWILYSQAVIVMAIILIGFLNPAESIALVALVTVAATFASATQDIAIAAWRIRAATTEKLLSEMTAMEQFSYRLAAFMGGAVMLIYADANGWPDAWLLVAVAMAACLALLFIIPDVQDATGEDGVATVTLGAALGADRKRYLWPVVMVWAAALAILFGFMAYMLLAENPPSTRNFTLYAGPVIIAACVGAPVVASILITKRLGNPAATQVPATGLTDHLYVTLLEPMLDLIFRLRYAAILVLILVLTYRFTDTIWGAFAYPFYLGAPETGGLAYTLAEVGVASKVFGVAMTIAGTAIGGFFLAVIGRMNCLVIGGIIAAATNLLYADLALGGVRIDAFNHFVGIDNLYPALNGFVNWLETTPVISDPVMIDDRIARLMTVIAGENLALGFASVVYVVYLSSIVNKEYAAVQYALLASLTMLIGVMGRGYLGELIEERGYAFVFVMTAVLGIVGILASIAEWIRVRRSGTAQS